MAPQARAGRNFLEELGRMARTDIIPAVQGFVSSPVRYTSGLAGRAGADLRRGYLDAGPQGQPSVTQPSSLRVGAAQGPQEGLTPGYTTPGAPAQAGAAAPLQNFVRDNTTGRTVTMGDLEGGYSQGNVGLRGRGSFSTVDIAPSTGVGPARSGLGRKIELSDYLLDDRSVSQRRADRRPEEAPAATSIPGFVPFRNYRDNDRGNARQAADANARRIALNLAKAQSTIGLQGAQATALNEAVPRTLETMAPDIGLRRQKLGIDAAQAEAALGSAEATAAESEQRTAGLRVLNNLRQRLAAAETPEERTRLGQDIAALEGNVQRPERTRAANVYLGQTDAAGTPIPSSVLISDSGEVQPITEGLRRGAAGDVTAQAQAAYDANPANLAEINKRLKAAGYKPLTPSK